MNVYLDANILVTVLNKEFPTFGDCARVLSLADNNKFKLYTSPLCLGIAWYFAEKKSGSVLARKKMSVLLNHIHVSLQDQDSVKKAINNPKIKDLEDGMGYYSALENKCKCIVTADKKDFYFSEIDVLNAAEFLDKYYFKR